MTTSAKFPTAVLALVDVGGEMPGFNAAVLSGAHNNSTATITLTATVPTPWPTAGWVTIDSEIIQYAGKSGATLTGCTRGAQSSYGNSVAASHSDQAQVFPALTPLAWNQLVADVIAHETFEKQNADIASSGTTDLSAAVSRYLHVTGTTTITAFGTVAAGRWFILKFDGILTLTHNASSLILRSGANATTAAGDVYAFVSEGSGNWREVWHLTPSTAVANGTLISRYINSATLNATNASAGTYVDFGGSFTTSPTVLTGDKICVRVSGIHRKSTAGSGAIVVDRGGTKLPSTGPTSSAWTDLIGSYTVFSFEYWDTPGAGTFTYKPQGYTSDANTYGFGGGSTVNFVVEVWR